MKFVPPDQRRAISAVRLSFALVLTPLMPLLLYAAPAWWSQRNVLVQNAPADDYAAANQGQLKSVAKAAIAEMDAKLPGGAGTELHNLLAAWSVPTAATNDFAPLNLSQLKNVAKPFYDRLIAVKYTERYPWIASGAVPDDFAVANIGQSKTLFSFDFVATDALHDTDGNDLPDWWERYYFGQIGIDPTALALRGDGITNFEAFQRQLDPINDGQVLAINPERIDETVPTGQSVTRIVRVTNATNATRQLSFSTHAATAIVNYSYTDSDHEGGPEFVWNDISTTGVHLDIVSDADNGFEGFPISFSFPYYGDNYTTVYVASDGFVTLGSGSDSWWGGAMPDSHSPAAMIAAFEDDLDLGASGDVYYQDYGDRVVIQFENAVRYYQDGYVTFQIVLQRDGTITFYYKDMQGTMDGAVVGIQSLATNQGLTIAYYQPYLRSDLAIRITPSTEWQPAPWLHLAPATMALAPGAIGELAVTLDGRGLAQQLYFGAITLSSADPSITQREFPVTMTLVDESQLDNDNDGLTNAQERGLGTDPDNIDADRDGMPDGWEIAHGLNPLVNDAAADPDSDGVSNLEEYRRRTDPFDFFDGAIPFIDIVSGNNQFGEPGAFAAQPLTVRVRKSNGQPYGNAAVVFTVPFGAGQLASTSSPVVLQGQDMTVRTNKDGVASARFQFSDTPGNSSRITAGTRAFERFVTTDFRAVSAYHPPPPGPTPLPGSTPSPSASPTATPAAPYRYALIDLGKDVFPDRVNNKGWVLGERGADSFRWKGGVFEVLADSRPFLFPPVAWDMNDDGTAVGTGGQWGTDESPNPNDSWTNKEISWGLVWPPNSIVPTEIRGSRVGYWAPTMTGRTIQRAYLRTISNPTAETGSADVYGGAFEGSGYSIFRGGVYYYDILNAYRWSESGGSPTPLSFSSSVALNEGSWVFDWHGPMDQVMRANSSRHYIGLRTNPLARVGVVNTLSTTGMIDGQQVDFNPTDINEAGIVVGYRESAMVIRTPGQADQTIIGRSNLSPVAINDHTAAISQSAVSPSPRGTPIVAPQILAQDGNVLLLWERQLDGTTWHPFSLEEMISNMDGWSISYVTDMNDAGVIIGRASYKDPNNPQADREAHGIMLVPAELMVDANRDGEMSFDDPVIHDADQTSEERPYRFWLNNDHDEERAVDTNDREQDDYDAGPDFDNPALMCERDLEDWSRLWISFRGMVGLIKAPGSIVELSWKPATGRSSWLASDGFPGLKVILQDSQAGAGATDATYLFDKNAATIQAHGIWGGVIRSVSPSASCIVPNDFLQFVTEEKPFLYLLFEGWTAGKGQLLVSVKKDGKTIAQLPGIDLDLRDVKTMYERYSVGDVPQANTSITSPVDYSVWPADRPTLLPNPSGTPFEPPFDEENNYILWVHGWNMSVFDKESYGDTAFKRLFWQGYKGRFGTFRWPTFFFTSDVPPIHHFDASEHRAWASSLGLLALLNELNAGPFSGKVRVMAHSMGNVVASEAIRRSNSGQVVHTYVASQAAISAQMYDVAAPAMQYDANLGPTTPDVFGYYWRPGTAQPHEWAMEGNPSYMHPQYLSPKVGRCFNYYNDDDWALTWPRWQLDQQTKPDANYGYEYSGAGASRGFWRDRGLGATWLTFPEDRHEIFAWAAESRSYALGAQWVAGVVAASTGENVDLKQPPFNYAGQHKYHSGQFRGMNMERHFYWRQLLIDFGLKEAQ